MPRPKRPREETPSTKRSKASKVQSSAEGNSNGADKSAKLIVNNVPHRILFAQNLPEACTDQMLASLFQQYAGFQEVRMVSGKGLAFIEFQDVVQAGIALQQLNGFQLSATDTLNLTYGNQ